VVGCNARYRSLSPLLLSALDLIAPSQIVRKMASEYLNDHPETSTERSDSTDERAAGNEGNSSPDGQGTRADGPGETSQHSGQGEPHILPLDRIDPHAQQNTQPEATTAKNYFNPVSIRALCGEIPQRVPRINTHAQGNTQPKITSANHPRNEFNPMSIRAICGELAPPSDKSNPDWFRTAQRQPKQGITLQFLALTLLAHRGTLGHKVCYLNVFHPHDLGPERYPLWMRNFPCSLLISSSLERGLTM
jgi:hypothetical protein